MPSRRAQKGAVLMVALMFLVALTLLAVTSMTGTTMEERMAGQYRDLNAAFQSAEAALRDAERDVYGVYNTLAAPSPVRATTISGKTGFGDQLGVMNGVCTDNTNVNFGMGLCYPRDNGIYPRFPTADLSSASIVAVPYGQYTGASPLQFVTIQPRYIIEALWIGIAKPPGQSLKDPPQAYYRITTRGYGGNVNTQVTLQEMYLVPQIF
jgi:type IV pilus assembly protein PilX